MKKLSVFCLIAILGIVLWALPAGAEKIRMTDAELDGITAGVPPPPPFPCGQVCVPFDKTGGVAGAGISAFGNLAGLTGTFAAGGGTPLAGGFFAQILGSGHLSSPTWGARINLTIQGVGSCIPFGAATCPPFP